MWRGRRSCRHAGAVLLAMLLLTPAAHAQTGADPGAAAAADIAYRAAAEGAALCASTVDRESVSVAATPYLRVTPFRPAGYDVRVLGRQGLYEDSFESMWLVARGVAHPQNVPAARLAQGCGDTEVSPGTPLDWHRLPYLDPTSGAISVGSGPAWTGAAVVAGLVPFAGVNRPLADPHMPIWARTCGRGARTVRFSRTVFLLGPPGELGVSITNVSRGVSRWPFSSVQLLINGTSVLRKRTPGDAGAQLPPELLQAVATGANRLDVVVRKKRTGPCNQAGGGRQIGVSVALEGSQAWSLEVTRPPVREQVGAVSITDLAVPYTVVNRGPSTLLEPVLWVRTSFSSPSVVSPGALTIAPDGGPEPGCANTDVPSTGTYATVCGMEPLAPGGSRTFTIAILGRPGNRPPPYLVTWRMDWSFNGMTGDAPGSFCVPPVGASDCRSLPPV